MANLSIDGPDVWARVPQLPPEVEEEAAHALIDFLKEIDAEFEQVLADESGASFDALHKIYEFSRFKTDWLKFILPTIGVGEVRIILHDGLVKIEETGIPCLWRMQMDNQESFILTRVPLCVRHAAREGDAEIGKIVNNGTDVFAAPAILEQLRSEQEKINWESLSNEPAFMVEFSGEPLSAGDSRAILSTLGTGNIEVRLQGFAESRIERTRVRGVWHSRLINNAGKELLEGYVTAYLPPEVPSAWEALEDAHTRCQELIQWMQDDLARGAIGVKN